MKRKMTYDCLLYPTEVWELKLPIKFLHSDPAHLNWKYILPFPNILRIEKYKLILLKFLKREANPNKKSTIKPLIKIFKEFILQ